MFSNQREYQGCSISTNQNLFNCTKCSEEITLEFPKDTVFLSYKHIIHYDCIDNLRQKCSTCPHEKEESQPDIQSFSNSKNKKWTKTFVNKPSNKKVKQAKIKDSFVLKKFIRKLSIDVFKVLKIRERKSFIKVMQHEGKDSTRIFLTLYRKINDTKDKLEVSNQKLIFCYYNFEEALS